MHPCSDKCPGGVVLTASACVPAAPTGRAPTRCIIENHTPATHCSASCQHKEMLPIHRCAYTPALSHRHQTHGRPCRRHIKRALQSKRTSLTDMQTCMHNMACWTHRAVGPPVCRPPPPPQLKWGDGAQTLLLLLLLLLCCCSMRHKTARCRCLSGLAAAAPSPLATPPRGCPCVRLLAH